MPLFYLSFLAKRVSDPELILVPFVVRKGEFLEDDLDVNQTWNIDYQKRFPVIPMCSMCQEASVCRGSVWNENLE